MRVADVIASMRRVAKLKDIGSEQLDEFDELASQFNAISEFRDRLVHRGANVTTFKPVSTNVLIAKLHEDVEVLVFAQADMMKATLDLSRIMVRLFALCEPRLLAMMDDETKQEIYGPWLYKRLEPHRPNRPPKPAKIPKRARPPRASRG